MEGSERAMGRITNRWTFRGTVEAITAVHVGGVPGSGLMADRTIVRDAADRPYLPAATIKGALRSCVDRLAPVVGAGRHLTSCGLSPREEVCPSPIGSPAHQAMEGALREFRGSAREREDQFLRLLNERLCSACRLFGSPWLGGRLYFTDARSAAAEVPIEVRDGIGIDRDSGVAVDVSRHSYEVIPATLRFAFQADADNLDEADQALIALALAEWQRGAIRLGGGAARGLGATRLALEEVTSIDFQTATATERREYLRTGAMAPRDPGDWLGRGLDWLEASEDGDAGA